MHIPVWQPCSKVNRYQDMITCIQVVPSGLNDFWLLSQKILSSNSSCTSCQPLEATTATASERPTTLSPLTWKGKCPLHGSLSIQQTWLDTKPHHRQLTGQDQPYGVTAQWAEDIERNVAKEKKVVGRGGEDQTAPSWDTAADGTLAEGRWAAEPEGLQSS